MTKTLPAGFTELEPFIELWALSTESERLTQRLASTLDELRVYYDVISELAPRALDHLQSFGSEELPENETTLLELLFSLAEIAPAIEMFNSVVEEGVYDPRKITIVHEQMRV